MMQLVTSRSTRTQTQEASSTTSPAVSVRTHRSFRPLAGKVIGIDPGHNGRNYTDPGWLNHLIWSGREQEACTTVGTDADSGYNKAQFNFSVATDLAGLLQRHGARVVMTRHTNTGVGPCVHVRARIIDRAHAKVALDIRTYGGPPTGRWVAILEPVADGPNNHIIGASKRFGYEVLHEMEDVAGMPPSDYDGTGRVVFRNDRAGLNLTTVPEVLIESGSTRNATDAAALSSVEFQHREALAIADAIQMQPSLV